MQKVWIKEEMGLLISADGSSVHATTAQIRALEAGKISDSMRSKLRQIGINLAPNEELAVR